MGKKSIFWLIIVLLLSVPPAFATHIVGGEFELQHLEGNQYLLRLIVYNDDVNGNPGAIDPEAVVYIWSKRDNRLISSVVLPLVSREPVNYTNPDCAIAELGTSKVVYSAVVELTPQQYGDAGGYYVTYERCCRNNIINNIVAPDATGQTFYLEFPAVVANGEPFINSSPVLFPPLSDFARLGYPFFFDFSGTDPDGDSLVYSLATPLAGYSSPDAPLPATPYPAPYPRVTWASGYGVENMVPGNPPLSIDKEGILRVKPSQAGLFVFSVLAEEFRDGRKIGEVRRDFQMLVYDVAGEDFPPVLEAVKDNGDILRDDIRLTEADFPANGERCVNLRVTDADILAEDNFEERLRFRIVPVNFPKANAEDIQLSVRQGTVTSGDPALFLNFCLPECPLLYDKPYEFLVVAYDDVCSVPLTDTLRVEVALDIPPNEPAYFLDVAAATPVREAAYAFPVVTEGTTTTYILEGYDEDGDDLALSLIADGFNPEQSGFTIEKLSEELQPDGRRKVRYAIQWDASCTRERNFGEKNEFAFQFALDDTPTCDRHEAALYQLIFKVAVPENIPPTVLTALNDYQPAEEVVVDVTFGQEFTFLVRALDSQQDSLRLKAVGADFNLADWGMNFEEVTGRGDISGQFRWMPSCEFVAPGKKDLFTVYFVAEDIPSCSIMEEDVIAVNLRLNFPGNLAPELSAQLSGGASQEVYEVTAGEELSLLLRGVDANTADPLLLRLQGIEQDSALVQYRWQDASGVGEVSSLLQITPGCEVLKGAQEALLTFYFQLNDQPCYAAASDLLEVKVLVKEKVQDFSPVNYVNVFTPNGDNCNPVFEIRNLPEDACNNRFEYVRVYNRWGKLVYESTQRDFAWDGEGATTGVYYYLLKYTNQTYRSPLSLILGDTNDCAN